MRLSMKNYTIPFALIINLLLSMPSLAASNTSTGKLRNYSTIHSIGIEWEIVGDDNHNATCVTSYRKQGASGWKTAMPLYRVDFVPQKPVKGQSQRFNGFAGSVLFLEPAANYEVRLTLTDPDGAFEERIETVFTRPIPAKPTNGRTFHVIPGKGGGNGSSSSPFAGIEAAQFQAQPGDIFLLHAGVYHGFDHNGEILLNKAGSRNAYVVWQAADAGAVIFEDPVRIAADHIWLEGIHVRGHRGVKNEYGLRNYSAPENIVVKKNKFTDFQYSIAINHGGEGWYIVDNVIVGDKDVIRERDGAPSWTGEGIELQHTGGHTIAYNSISRVADGISSPLYNTDIFRNEIFDTTDDGIEPDSGYANIRVWENRISNVRHNGFSFQPMNSGPWYFIRNQVAAPLESTLKIRQTSRVLLAHNIFVGWNNAMGKAFPANVPGILTFESKNNIWISLDNNYAWVHTFDSSVAPDWRTSLDYDGFDWGSSDFAFKWGDSIRYPTLGDFQVATGLQPNAIHINKNTCFEAFNIPSAPPASMPFQHMSLKKSCNAVDAGVLLPNINDRFSGNAPDLGPYEVGASLPHFGPRANSNNAPQLACGGSYQLPNNEWHQISLPCRSNQLSTINNLFGDDLPGTYGTDWKIFKFDTTNNSYVELKSADNVLTQGIGYWIIQISDETYYLEMPLGSTTVKQSNLLPFRIKLGTKSLSQQWNMVGFPLATHKSLNTARVKTTSGACNLDFGCSLNIAQSNNVVENYMWSFNGKSNEQVNINDTLKPWKGYWFLTLENADGVDPYLLFQ